MNLEVLGPADELFGETLVEAQNYAATRAVTFFCDYLKHIKGEWARSPAKPLIPDAWQIERILDPVFGTLLPNGLRQYRTVYIEIPRKNGKSTIGAGIALKLLCADGEPGGEIYSAAGDKEQARIVFNVAGEMVKKSPKLRRKCKVYKTAIVVEETGSSYKAVSADAFTKHGFNASGIIFDELHTQPNRELWDVLTTSTGSRQQPLTVALTTAGYDRMTICWEIHQYAMRVLKGEIHDPTFLAVIFAADQKADWKDPAVWAFANPGLGTSVKLDYLKAQCNRAIEIPGYENTFRRLHLNQWTEQATRWLPMDKWDLGAQPGIDELIRSCIGEECDGGLDLASVGDLTALELVFRKPGKKTKVISFFWVPEEGAEKRSRTDKVPYLEWIRNGFIRATSGNVTDYNAILRDIKELGNWFKFREVGFDPWNSTQLVTDLINEGFTMVPVRQGVSSLSPPSKELENLLLGDGIEHGGHPVLRWNAQNIAVRSDANGNLAPARDRSTEKIDGIVALLIALSRAILHGQPKRSIYETRGIRTLGGESEKEV
jgi:phage terminase large subunit-like protein